jgi:D-alanyl-D-alanine dipeptidase
MRFRGLKHGLKPALASLLLLAAATLLPAQSVAPSSERSSRRAKTPSALASPPAPAPAAWVKLIGDYYRGSSKLYILEKDGSLMALAQSPPLRYIALEQRTADFFAFAGDRSGPGKGITFLLNPQGAVTGARLGSAVFLRQEGVAQGQVFRITLRQPVEQLRREALARRPPPENRARMAAESDLVDLTKVDPTIKLDIRYATSNNFMGAPMYSEARAFLEEPAAKALGAASQRFRALGYGLLVYDAYRPWYVTKMFWDGTPPDKRIFVANPKRGSRHNRGCAVDLTLYSLRTGQPVPMTGGYDEMSERSYPTYPGGTSLERWDRDLLREVMGEEGFTVNEYEWWHFDYKDWPQYPILNITFEELDKRRPSEATSPVH